MKGKIFKNWINEGMGVGNNTILNLPLWGNMIIIISAAIGGWFLLDAFMNVDERFAPSWPIRFEIANASWYITLLILAGLHHAHWPKWMRSKKEYR